MNNLAFQIYGSKKTGVFQSTWDTTLVSALGAETAAVSASGTNWTLNTGATNLNVGGYKHTVGSTTNLTTTIGATIMQMYQITYTISGRTAGSVSINYGAVTTSGITASSVVSVLATTTTVLSITPTSDFDGVVSISLKQTSSTTNQIKLPLPNIETYNIYVDWGDGTYDNITSYNSIKTLHTYPSSGIYTVRITGAFNWQFNNFGTNDRLKIKTISSWGKLKLGTHTFNGCSNLTLSGITDVVDLSNVTSLIATFANCSSITTIGRIGEWNMTNINSTTSMFVSCSLFNQSLSSWERVGSTLANVTDMSAMFQNTTQFNGNLSGWNVSKVTTFASMFQEASAFNNGATAGAGGTMPWTINTTTSVTMTSMFYNHYSFNQDIGSWDVSKVTSFASFLYHDNGPQGNTFNNGYSDSIKNWNVGSCTNFTSMFVKCRFNQPVHLWNMSKATSIDNMFFNCVSFNNGYASGVANQLTWSINTISNVSMSSVFNGCLAFNSNLGTGTTPWDMSKVTTFASMFLGATNFNNGDNTADINNWSINTVSSVNMNAMFSGASVFNRDIENWNMTKVNNTSSMFQTAIAFNKSLNNWERVGSTMANIINMSAMFSASNFNNGSLSGVANQLPWDTSACTNMSSMFSNDSSFNSNLGTASTPWNVSKVTTFLNMFYGTSNFNNGDNTAAINDWNIGGDASVTTINMSAMFRGSSIFNRLVDNWNMTKVNNISSMFGYTNNFNQSLNNWERVGSTMANIINMSGMFFACVSFNNGYASGVANQLSWNTSSCTDMSGMFQSASAFNSNLGTGTTPWDVAKVANFGQMFSTTANFNNGDNTASINDWNIGGDASVGNVISMYWMFRGATVFNRLVDNWNMTKVNSTNNMFSYINYNQPLANWERTGSTLANVVNMVDMFWNNDVFNQNIGNWNVSGVTNFSGFMATKTPSRLSSANLDAIYNNTTGWVTRGVKPNIIISFGTAKYSQAGKTGKDALLASPNNWTITDGLLSVSTTSNNGGLIRVTTTAVHGFTASTAVYIYDVGGTTNANGTFTASVINTTQIELQASTYNAVYTSGGKLILG